MGRTRTLRRLIILAALSALTALPLAGCRKMGFDESPRTMPGDAPESLGPKRLPVNQHSSQNTPEARRALATGAVSPGPSDMASLPSPQPIADPYSGYAEGNFWSNGEGWGTTPPPASGRAAAPTPQMRPAAQQQLPPLQLLRQPPPQQAMTAPGMPPARYSAAPPQPAPAMIPAQMPYQTAYAPPPNGAMHAQQADFPSLYEIPNQPYYRNNNEIAADLADLQNESRTAMMYQQPAYMPYMQDYAPQGYMPDQSGQQGYNAPPPAAMMQPDYAMQQQQYAPPPPSYQPDYAQQQPAMPMQSATAGWPDPGNYPDYAPAMGGGYDPYQYGAAAPAYPAPYPPAPMAPMMGNASAYNLSAFVSPAPVAGVPDMPAMTQDWDSGAYRTPAGTAPIELRMPYPGSEQAFLPESRYTGIRRGPFSYH